MNVIFLDAYEKEWIFCQHTEIYFNSELASDKEDI